MLIEISYRLTSFHPHDLLTILILSELCKPFLSVCILNVASHASPDSGASSESPPNGKYRALGTYILERFLTRWVKFNKTWRVELF